MGKEGKTHTKTGATKASKSYIGTGVTDKYAQIREYLTIVLPSIEIPTKKAVISAIKEKGETVPDRNKIIQSLIDNKIEEEIFNRIDRAKVKEFVMQWRADKKVANAYKITGAVKKTLKLPRMLPFSAENKLSSVVEEVIEQTCKSKRSVYHWKEDIKIDNIEKKLEKLPKNIDLTEIAIWRALGYQGKHSNPTIIGVVKQWIIQQSLQRLREDKVFCAVCDFQRENNSLKLQTCCNYVKHKLALPRTCPPYVWSELGRMVEKAITRIKQEKKRGT